MTKRFLFSLALMVGLTGSLFAQDLKKTLGETVKAFFDNKDQAEKNNQSNRLVLISKKFNTEWSASYYAALSKIMLNYNEPDNAKKDALLDEADDLLAQAASLSDKNNAAQQSEIYALTAMAANARLGVDPQKRWQKYGKIFEANLENAKKSNEANPRIYFLKGTSVFYTPKAFGGGKKKALEYFEKAAPLFAKESSDDITIPSWGKEVNEEYVKLSQTED
jgi:outer membrane murein-binding lipoprotein Lpp